MIFVGAILKFVYVARFSFGADAGAIWSPRDRGFIECLYESKSLLTCVQKGFYGAPLYYIFAACVYDMARLFYADSGGALESVAMMNALFSAGLAPVSYGIIKKLPIRRTFRVPAVAMVCFFPSHYLLGASIGPKALSAFLSLLVIDAFLRWEETREAKYFGLMLLYLPLSMWTDAAAVVVWVVPASGLLWLFIRRGSQRDKSWIGLALGLVAALPVGIGWEVAMAALYGAPLIERDLEAKGAKGMTVIAALFRPNEALAPVLAVAIALHVMVCLMGLVWLLLSKKTVGLYRWTLLAGLFSSTALFLWQRWNGSAWGLLDGVNDPCVLLYLTGGAWMAFSMNRGGMAPLGRWLLSAAALVVGIEATALYLFYL